MREKSLIYKILGLLAFGLFIIMYTMWHLTNKNTYSYIFNIIITCALVLVFVVFCIKYKDKESISFDWLENKKYRMIALASILILGVLLRTILFGNLPNGMMADEWSMVYESWSIGHYGVDRNGNFLPVYLVAWGSGQNALLSYLSIPFVMLFGMNAFSARIVMLLSSFATMIGVYCLVKRISNYKLALVSTIICAIIPWNVMLARWGLESNLLPCFLLFGVLFLVKAYFPKENVDYKDKGKSHWYFLLSCLFFGLSLYAYATAYVFVPLFLIVVYLYLIFKKKIKWNSFLIGNIILFALALPLILFMAINFLDLPQFQLFGIFTIPRLTKIRSVVANGFDIIGNLKSLVKLLIWQDDGLTWNSITPFGFVFPISLPFFVIGCIYGIKDIVSKKNNYELDMLIYVWCFISILSGFMLSAGSINHINTLVIPSVYIISKGICYFIASNRFKTISVAVAYSLCLVTFCSCYFTPLYGNDISSNYSVGYCEAVQFAESIREDDGTIKVVNFYNSIIALVASKTSPIDYYDTVVYEDANTDFRVVNSFTHYNFGDIEDGDTLIIMNEKDESLLSGEWQTKHFNDFIVCYK